MIDEVPKFQQIGGGGTCESTISGKTYAVKHFVTFLVLKRLIVQDQRDWLTAIEESKLCSESLFREFAGFLFELKQRNGNFYECSSAEQFLSGVKDVVEKGYPKMSSGLSIQVHLECITRLQD